MINQGLTTVHTHLGKLGVVHASTLRPIADSDQLIGEMQRVDE